jgi:ribose transport system permease protein
MSAVPGAGGAPVSRPPWRADLPVARAWPWAAAVILWLIACAVSGGFSFQLLFASLTLAVFLALAGLGQMVVLASGDGSFDLSLPYTITLAGYISAGAISAPAPERILIAVVVGMAVGAANGVLTAVLKFPGIIASLAVGYVLFTVILFVEANPATSVSGGLYRFIRLQADGASAVLVIEVAIALVVAALLARTVYGRFLHAMGQSRPAAALAGVPVRRMIVTNFVVCGVLAGCVGVLLTAYDGGAFANMGDTYLLGSVAAVVVGGTPVGGGKTSVAGTLAGALIMTLLVTMLELTNASPGAQDLSEGLAVIAVVAGAGLVARVGRRQKGSAR